MIDPEESENTNPVELEKPKPTISLERLKRMFRIASDATEDNNVLCVRDRDFFDGDQLIERR